MTIKEFASKQGVSTQAVYARLKTAKIDLATIKRENSQELTEEGCQILVKLFDKEDTSKESVEKLKNTISELQSNLKEAREQTEYWKEQADAWKSIAEKAQETAQQAQKTAQQAQTLQAQAMQIYQSSIALPAPEEKKSFWKRLIGK